MLPEFGILALMPPREPHFQSCLHGTATICPIKAPENLKHLLLRWVQCHPVFDRSCVFALALPLAAIAAWKNPLLQ